MRRRKRPTKLRDENKIKRPAMEIIDMVVRKRFGVPARLRFVMKIWGTTPRDGKKKFGPPRPIVRRRIGAPVLAEIERNGDHHTPPREENTTLEVETNNFQV